MSGKLKSQAIALAQNVLFMADKLNETRQNAADMPIVIAYDNGGGQKGIRKNPVFEAYSQLFNSYLKGLIQLEAMIGNQAEPTAKATQALEALRANVLPLKRAENG